MTRLAACLAALFLAFPALAEIAPRAGWAVYPTEKPYEQLIEDVKAAAQTNKMGIVTEAGPTGAAAQRGITIPGNRVIGIFNNVIAVEVLGLSTAAMIEAPVRMYVTENADGTASLSYKLPSTVFAPYVEQAGPRLSEIAAGLDATFATIAEAAIE
jgi:uncharacterized protein (DUF302 family)